MYEIPKPKPHHHLICRTCGKEAMDGMFALIAERYGFRAETDHLVLYGVCAARQQEMPKR